MWPIGGSSCDQTLNSKSFDMLPIRMGKLPSGLNVKVENASIGALMMEKKKTTNTNLIRPWLRHWPN